MPRVFAPDEEIPFHFTAGEINAIIAAIETTLGLSLRVTAPLREKILKQLEAPLAAAGGDGLGIEGEAVLAAPVTASRGGPRYGKRPS